MNAMEKMLSSMIGLSPDELKEYVGQAINLLVSLNSQLEVIAKNSEEANERLKRIEKEMGIKAPLQLIETSEAKDGTNG